MQGSGISQYILMKQEKGSTFSMRQQRAFFVSHGQLGSGEAIFSVIAGSELHVVSYEKQQRFYPATVVVKFPCI